MRSAVHPGDDVIDRGAARRVRQVIPAPRAAPVLQLHQFGHECQAVRCPRHHLVVMLPIASPGPERPAAEPLPGRHRQPAHTAPARLRRHDVNLTGRSDIAAVAGGQRGGPCGSRVAARSAAAAPQVRNFAGRLHSTRASHDVAVLRSPPTEPDKGKQPCRASARPTKLGGCRSFTSFGAYSAQNRQSVLFRHIVGGTRERRYSSRSRSATGT